jgi:hypothetical protein
MDGGDKIWYKNLSGFITKSNYHLFFPSRLMTLEEKLNAIMRFVLYTFVFVFLINRTYHIMGPVIIVTALVTIGIYEIDLRERERKLLENMRNNLTEIDGKACRVGTEDNPFGNPNMMDLGKEEKIEMNNIPACDIDNVQVKKSIEDNFDSKLYHGIEDEMSKSFASRAFFTVPNTKMPAEQDKFTDFLYSNSFDRTVTY